MKNAFYFWSIITMITFTIALLMAMSNYEPICERYEVKYVSVAKSNN